MDDLHIRICLQEVFKSLGNNPFPFDDIDTSQREERVRCPVESFLFDQRRIAEEVDRRFKNMKVLIFLGAFDPK